MTSRQSTPLGASAIRQANLREHNLGLVLRLIIDSPVPVSRADIAVATGLTRATVSSLADRLIMASLVDRTATGDVAAGRPAGRPAGPGGRDPRGRRHGDQRRLPRRAGGRPLRRRFSASRSSRRTFAAATRSTVMRRLSDLYCEVTESDRRRRPDGRQLPGHPGAGRPDDRPGADGAQPGLAGGRRGQGVPLPSGHRARCRSGWTTRPPSAPGRRPTRSGRPERCRSCTSPARWASAARWWSTARCSAAGTAGAAKSATPWSIPAGPLCRCGATGCLEQYAGKDALMRSAAMDLDLPVTALMAAAEAGNHGRAGLLGRRCPARWAPPWPTRST